MDLHLKYQWAWGHTMIRNWYLLTGIIIIAISSAPIIFFLIPKQIKEVRRKSNNKAVKKYVLGLEMAIVFCMFPGLPRAFQVLNVDPVNNWARLAAVMNRLPYIFMTALLLLIWFYKLKPEDPED